MEPSNEQPVLAHWTCDEDVWKTYLEEQPIAQAKQNNIISTIFGVVSGIIVFLIFYREMSIEGGLLFGTIIGLFAAFAQAFTSGRFNRRRFAQHLKSNDALIACYEDSIHLNAEVITLKRVTALQIVENLKCPVIEVTRSELVGSREDKNTYSIPIPLESMDEVRRMLKYYTAKL